MSQIELSYFDQPKTKLNYSVAFNNKPVNARNCELYTGYTSRQLIGLTGIHGLLGNKKLPSATFKIDGEKYPKINLTVHYENFLIEETVDVKKKEINIDFFIHHELRQQGFAFKLLASQIEHCRAAGIKKITCFAIGDFSTVNSLNGYITWPKLGFVMDESYQDKFSAITKGRPEKSVFELFETTNGDKFWKKKGFPHNCTFYLSRTKPSLKRLKKYAESKGYAF